MKKFAVIFDMDGVIIDSNPYHTIALRQFCEKYGYHLTEEELLKKIFGRTNKEWIANLFNRPMTKEDLSQFGEEKEALFREIYKNDIKPVDGLGDFLEQLKAHAIPAAIGTSAPRSNVDFVLAKTHFEKYFSVTLDESNVTQGKPNPEIYQKVAAALNFAPEQCVVFEDSLSGVEAAQRAGCKVVGITTTHTPQELSHTNFNIPDFKNLEISRLESLF